MTQRRLFANMPADARAAYEEAQHRFSQTIKSAEDPGKDKPEVAEQRRESAAVVVNADLLADAIGRRKGIKADCKPERKTQFSQAADFLGDAIQQARARRATKANVETVAKAETVCDLKPSLAELLLAGSEE